MTYVDDVLVAKPRHDADFPADTVKVGLISNLRLLDIFDGNLHETHKDFVHE